MTLEGLAKRTSERLRAEPRPAPQKGSPEAAILAVQTELAHYLEAIRGIETKATLVIPVFGVVAAAFSDRALASPLPALATAAAAAGVLSATLSVVYALRCLSSSSYSVGPDPVLLARATSAPSLAVQQAILDSLAIAAVSARVVVIAKSAYLNRSLLAGGSTLATLAAFLFFGGFS